MKCAGGAAPYRAATPAPNGRTPGMAHPPSRLCASDICHRVPYTYRTLHFFACSSHDAASYPFPVRRASALPPASFRFPVTQDTLAGQLTLPRVGHVGDSHPQVSAPCRAHKEKGLHSCNPLIKWRARQESNPRPPGSQSRRSRAPKSEKSRSVRKRRRPDSSSAKLAHGGPAELTRSPPRLRHPGLQSWASMAAFSEFANRGRAQLPDRLEPLDALEFA